MTFLPIVGRELRSASRRRSTYWLRTCAALAVMGAGTWLVLILRGNPPQEIAQGLFGILTGSAVLYGLISGGAFTADCLSEEKREGTLGLLFLTDLKGYDVVLGKLAATSLNGLYGVLAVLPMMGVPLLMGGITPGEFGRMALVAINTLFFSLAIGIGISAMSRSALKAVGTTFAVLMFFTAVLPACGELLVMFGKARQVEPLWLMSSAGRSFYLAWDKTYQLARKDFWWSMGVMHGLGWIFLALASVIAPRAWRDKPASAQRLRWRERWQLWSYGDLAERRAFRTRLLERNAFFWLAARARLKPALVWAVLGLTACGWAWGLAKFRRDWLNGVTFVTTAVLLNVILKYWVASEAGRQLAEDRRHGTLELLLSTPLTVRRILEGQRLALQRQFLGPVFATLVMGAVFLTAIKSADLGEEYGVWVLFWAGGMATFAADLVALYWVGMWHGLTAKNPSRAVSATLALILILPPVVVGIVALVVSLMSIREEVTLRFMLGLWYGVGLAVAAVFGTRARYKLLSQFRLAAAERYARRRGFWKRLFAGEEPKGELAPAVAGPE